MGHEAVHVTVWNDSGSDAPRVLLVHGTMTWGTDCFAAQRPLADAFRLDVMDRRGFGDSPDIERSDYEVDADDVVELLGASAHLVGYSYGGVVAMIAAARKPEAVRSLALIEPSALRVAEEHPVVAAALDRLRATVGAEREPVSPEDYLRMSTEPYGLPCPELTPRRIRATRTSMDERPCWDAQITLAPLAAATWPKLVVNGTWETAAQPYREFVGDAIAATGQFIAERIGADAVRVAGTDHYPHQDRHQVVNELLREFWTQGRSKTPVIM
ncbi:pimeloyl-ACP methyl ester carboxylesterase [Kitasatospora sp. GAS204A]|uniref:alpha/beta fold hydrolase n=1 Tax=unclassified Kitasatospora TaxID=2633591 RepID=UPI00247371D8|nr:alpha/beta hydrolase [Kitasatospora sp. GAS204B]MDH6118974.1 pimeloyl-ACP methyl ester carboxylesterase [Kitasatospora sp. GAS204B]